MEMRKHKFPYNWMLSEAKFTKDKGKVFSCFACGGGSTMGYKLVGFERFFTSLHLWDERTACYDSTGGYTSL